MLEKFLQSRVPWLLKATLNPQVGLPALCRETAELTRGLAVHSSENRNFAYLGNSVCPSESFVWCKIG